MHSTYRTIGFYKVYTDILGTRAPRKKDLLLELRSRPSRGEATYGDNIISFYVDEQKVSSCMGEADDVMAGRCVADWFARRFKNELLKLQIPITKGSGEMILGHYGLTYNAKNRSSLSPFEKSVPSIDGACGIPYIDIIMQECGYQLNLVSSKRSSVVWRLTKKSAKKPEELKAAEPKLTEPTTLLSRIMKKIPQLVNGYREARRQDLRDKGWAA